MLNQRAGNLREQVNFRKAADDASSRQMTHQSPAPSSTAGRDDDSDGRHEGQQEPRLLVRLSRERGEREDGNQGRY